MSLTVQQLLSDAKRLTGRLRDHDSAADGIISAAHDVLKEVEAMRQYQEDIDSLNTIAHNRPRAQLVLGIQQENRHIRQLQHENKELRAALEEHQNVLELIMSKYRQHMSCLVHSTKIEKDILIRENTKVLQDRADKICEMANVMQKSIQIDEDSIAKEQEILARLVTENRGLREMLEISHRNGSYNDPLVGPRLVSTACQTEAVNNGNADEEGADDNSAFNKIMAVPNPSSANNAANNGSSPNSLNSNTGSSGSNNTNCTSPRPRCSSTSSTNSTNIVMNGAIQEDAISPQRPLSSASEEESESSISEDDEISFNTIKRQVKASTTSDETTSSSAVKMNIVNSVKNCESSTEGGGGGGGDGQTNGLQILEDNNNGHDNVHPEDVDQGDSGGGVVDVVTTENEDIFSKKLKNTTTTTEAILEPTS